MADRLSDHPTAEAPGHTHIPDRLKAPVIYSCLAVILLSALAAVGYVYFLAQGGNVYQYHIAVALLCFALSAVSGLLLYGNVQFGGRWGDYTLALVGPASMWIITLAAFSYIFPDKLVTTFPPPHGEITYQAWLTKLRSVGLLFRKNEDQSVPSLLSNVYYPGNQHTKPSQVQIEQLLVYFPNGQAITIRRIIGRNDTGTAEIFHRPRPTGLTSPVASRAFTEHGGKFHLVNDINAKIWHTVSDADLRWYDVVLFSEQVEDADFFIVDVPKYIDSAKEGAKVDFALASSHPIREASLRVWEVIQPEVAAAGDIPLLFKEWSEVPEHSVTQINNDFNPFLQWLEQQRTSKDTIDPDFIEQLNKIMQSQTSPLGKQLPDVFNPSTFHSTLLFHLSEVKNSMIFTYQFE
jgi:hypothetical protein